jgi:DNA-binding response OmpR family regulator
LIIDDQADIRLLVKRILEGDGAQVTEAKSVEEGLRLAERKAPHLIITDLRMPERDGFDLLRVRRQIPKLAEVPTIVLSANDDRKSVVAAVALGATDYILKPIHASLLLQKVRKRLRSRAFLSRKLGPGDRPLAEASVAVELVSASESGLKIESPLKLAPDTTVSLAGEALDRLGADGILIRSSSAPEPYLSAGRYVSELVFVGIGEARARELRKRLAEWGSK